MFTNKALVLVPALMFLGTLGCGSVVETAPGSAEGESSGTTREALRIGTSNVDYIQCATENGTAVLGAAKYVAFGANGSYFFKSMPAGTFTCDRDTFGGDPAEGVVKACYYANYSLVATSDNTFYSRTSSPIEFAYGGNGQFVFAKLSGYTSYTCNAATFGVSAPPNPGGANDCYQALVGYHYATAENGSLTGLNNTPVAYGTDGFFNFAVKSGTVACNNQTFGDPIDGKVKACYTLDQPYLTNEGGSWSLSGDICPVLFTSGRNGNVSTFPAGCGWGACTNSAFNGDPDPGYVKRCYGNGYIF